jgi:alkanesulfonate monooxygenase SsuD/methylene tetrahydromethanopterin reductase-like flavin-dependent oxidoreductase (luciferase family)
MEFSVTESHIDNIDFIKHAEVLGYGYCAATDSQMIRSDCFSVLTLAAHQTRTIKLGSGVSVAGLRLAPVVANGIATINRLAPGRTFLTLGTGHTAMRLMGQPPMRLKEFAEYVRVVRALIRGETVDYTYRGATHPIQFMMRDHHYVDVDHYIPLYIAGDGPKTQQLAGEYGDGLMTTLPLGGTVKKALANARRGAERVGRKFENFQLAALINLAMLEPGESITSDRILVECGPAILSSIHAEVDRIKESGGEPPEFAKPIWNAYMKFHLARPAATRHQHLHGAHRTFLDREEARFLTAEVIQGSCLVGRPEQIVEQLRELETQGLTQFKLSPPPERKLRIVETFARRVMEKL